MNITLLMRRLRLLVSRAIVNVVNDAYQHQNLQLSVQAGEVLDDVERLQNYGHTSVPPAGSEAIMLSVGGKRQHPIAIVVDNKATRLRNLKAGDSALYHLEGHYLLLGENRQATLICKTLQVTADSAVFDIPETTFTGNMSILGNETVVGTSTAVDHISGGIKGKTHVHRCPRCDADTSTPK